MSAAVAAFGIASVATAAADGNGPADRGLLGAVTGTVGSTVTSVTAPLTGPAASASKAKPHSQPPKPAPASTPAGSTRPTKATGSAKAPGPAKATETSDPSNDTSHASSAGHTRSKAATAQTDRKPRSLLAPVADTVTSAARPATATVAKAAEPVTQRVRPIATSTAAPVTEGVSRTVSASVVEPVVEPATATVSSLVRPVAQVIEPVTAAAAPVLRPVTTALEPVVTPVVHVLEPVTAIAQPVTQIVAPIVAPVVEPVADATAPVVTDPIIGVISPVVVQPTDPAGPSASDQPLPATGQAPGLAVVAGDDVSLASPVPSAKAHEPALAPGFTAAATADWQLSGHGSGSDLPCAAASERLTGWAAWVAQQRLNGAPLVLDWGSSRDGAPWSPVRQLPAAPACTAGSCGSSIDRPQPHQLPLGLLADAATINGPACAQLAAGYSAGLSARAALIETRPG